MRKFNSSAVLRSMAVAAVVLSGIGVSPARASQVIFLFNSPGGKIGASQTYVDTLSGLSIAATGYQCVGLCAYSANTDYSSNKTALYGNSDGLGMANNQIGSKFEIPNTEFVQVDFSSIAANKTIQVQSIQYQMTDIFSSWSVYGSKVVGELEGVGGTRLVNNSTSLALQTITSPAYSLYDFLAGTACDVVLHEVIVNYSTVPNPAPEPATFVISGLALLAFRAILKKTAKKS